MVFIFFPWVSLHPFRELRGFNLRPAFRFGNDSRIHNFVWQQTTPLCLHHVFLSMRSAKRRRRSQIVTTFGNDFLKDKITASRQPLTRAGGIF
jgi:hypothetical protein